MLLLPFGFFIIIALVLVGGFGSLIVNLTQIRELQTGPHGEYIVVLEGGARLQSSRSYHDRIKRWAANPF